MIRSWVQKITRNETRNILGARLSCRKLKLGARFKNETRKMQQARSGTCDKRELGATTRNNASKIHDESQLCSGSKLWSRPPQGNVEKDERKQYRDHSSGTNEFDEPWIKDNAAQDVLFCTRMRTMQALVYIYIYIYVKQRLLWSTLPRALS